MLDNRKKMRCPACKNEMQKVFISKEGFDVDICADGCGGIWFDRNELKSVDEQNEEIDEIIAALDGKEFSKPTQEGRRFCPACGTNMAKSFSSVKKEIQIDECIACGGKFLDNQELQAIRNEYSTDTERRAAMKEFVKITAEAQLMKLRKEL